MRMASYDVCDIGKKIVSITEETAKVMFSDSEKVIVRVGSREFQEVENTTDYGRIKRIYEMGGYDYLDFYKEERH